MTIQQFGDTIKQKYPQYANIDSTKLGTAMIAKYPQYKSKIDTGVTAQNATPTPTPKPSLPTVSTSLGNQPAQQPQQSLTDKAAGTGMFDIPVLGGLLRSVVQPNTDYIDQLGQQKQQLQQLAQTNPQAAAQQLKQDLGSSSQLQNLVAGQGQARAALPAALTDTTLADVPGIASGVKNLATTIPSYMTKKGVASLTSKAAEAATAAGKNMTWDQLSGQIKKNVLDALGGTKDVKDALNTLLSDKVPPLQSKTILDSSGNPMTTNLIPKDLTPSELLKWRKQIGARGAGKGVFQNFFTGSNIEDKVNSIAKRTISENFHRIVPESINPDKAYSLYSKLNKVGGSPAGILGRSALTLGGGFAAGGLNQALGNPVGNIVKELTGL